MIEDILITIFIPVYNGERYLENTLLSIQNQTYTNFEVLLVDDTSTDNSFKILEEFAQKDTRFKVFQKPNGGFVSKSWNYILPEINGVFVFYSSQDDLFSDDLLEEMIKRQKETNADSILPDMEFYFENKKDNPKIIGVNNNREIVLSGKEACEHSLKWAIHGFTLSRTELVKNELYYEDAFDTDEYITREILFKSNKVSFSKGIFYYRQDNLNAITKTFTEKNFYSILTKKRVSDLFVKNNLKNKFDSQIIVFQSYLYLRSKYKKFNFTTSTKKNEIKLLFENFRRDLGSFKSLIGILKNSKGKLVLKTIYLWLKIRLFTL
ncbi:MAG: glycosyltransferase family 2 protein [Bacteroidota bacterium]